MNHYKSDPETFKNSLSAQEWSILNYLRLNDRDSFEINLQNFRKLQLTKSQHGKAKLCRLIEEIIRIDGQYSGVLIEDISHLLNDGNVNVQTEALGTFSRCLYQFMLNVFAAKAQYPDDQNVLTSLSDLACARYLTHGILLNLNSYDLDIKDDYDEATKFVHFNHNSAWSHAFKVLLRELALYAQIGALPSSILSPVESSFASINHPLNNSEGSTLEDNGANKKSKELKSRSRKGTAQKTVPAENRDSIRGGLNLSFTSSSLVRLLNEDTDLRSRLSVWCNEALDVLKGCMLGALKSKKKPSLVRSIMAVEVASTLIGSFPLYYDCLSPVMMILLARCKSFSNVYENGILRIFTSKAAKGYHPKLASDLNSVGYAGTLEEFYRKSHVLSSYNLCGYATGESKYVGVSTENMDELVDYATTEVRVDDDELLAKFKAVRLFECSSNIIKNLNSNNELYDCRNTNLRLHPPLDTQPPFVDTSVDAGEGRIEEHVTEKKIEQVKVDAIRKHSHLYLNLVVTQMMDTSLSYTSHLHTFVVGAKTDRFNRFRSSLFNKLILSDAVPESTREVLYKKLFDHIAHLILIEEMNVATATDGDYVSKTVITDSVIHFSARELFRVITVNNSLLLLEKYLDQLNDVVLFKSSIDIAKVLKTSPKFANDDSMVLSMVAEGTFSKLVWVMLMNLYDEGLIGSELRDDYLKLLCKFILGLPAIPLVLADLLQVWIDGGVSRILTLSLIPSILKKSQSSPLKEKVYMLFFKCVTCVDANVRLPFLKLISSPTGLYTPSTERRYSLDKLEMIHDELVVFVLDNLPKDATITGQALPTGSHLTPAEGSGYGQDELKSVSTDLLEGGKSEKITRYAISMHDDCLLLKSRPLWQWPAGLLNHITGVFSLNKKFMGLYDQIFAAEPCESLSDWQLMGGVWFEELLLLLYEGEVVPVIGFLLQVFKSQPDKINRDDYLLVMASKNVKLIPYIINISSKLEADLRDRLVKLCLDMDELALVFRYKQDLDIFLVEVLSEVRVTWWNLKYDLMSRWKDGKEVELLMALFNLIGKCNDYIIELSPFLTPDQLSILINILFKDSNEDGIKKILKLITEAPGTFKRHQKELGLSLPQHFIYNCYNLKVDGADLKRQISLLDYCVECCTNGQFTVEYALSACTLIVECNEISFVFGRLLCQLVQKVPLTRGVVVNDILPILLQKHAWDDRTLWRGVLITITTLWPSHKEQLTKLLLLLPQEYGEHTIKTLNQQHNAINYMRSLLSNADTSTYIPDYIKSLLSL